MSREEYPRGFDPSACEIAFHEEVDRRECLITKHNGFGVHLHMRSRTGPWTHVQGFGRHHTGNASITKASNFTAPAPVMAIFLQACLETL